MADGKQGEESSLTDEAILAQLKRIAREQLELQPERIERINLDARIVQGLELDSLAQVVLLTQVEEHYQLVIGLEDRERLHEVDSVGDLVSLIRELAQQERAPR